VETAGRELMLEERRWGHVVLAIQDLVTLAVLREEEIVLVGQLPGEITNGHTAPPSAGQS